MFTLAVADVFVGDSAHVVEGALACTHCRRRYPVIDGIPIVFRPGVQLRAHELVERDLHPATLALLAEPGPDDAPLARTAENLSIYLDAHWGDRATPPPDGPPHVGFRHLGERLAARAQAPVARAVELGASVGRGLAELARGAALVVGLDGSFAMLRRARRLLAGEDVGYARRRIGRHYAPATARGLAPGAEVVLVCADALDPPLVPTTFARVAALNLLDNVPTPAALLAVIDGLCAPGGEILLASPFAWQTGHVDEDQRLGGDDPAGDLERRLAAGAGLTARYTVEETADVAWGLRRDARSAALYDVRWLRARKA